MQHAAMAGSRAVRATAACRHHRSPCHAHVCMAARRKMQLCSQALDPNLVLFLSVLTLALNTMPACPLTPCTVTLTQSTASPLMMRVCRHRLPPGAALVAAAAAAAEAAVLVAASRQRCRHPCGRARCRARTRQATAVTSTTQCGRRCGCCRSWTSTWAATAMAQPQRRQQLRSDESLPPCAPSPLSPAPPLSSPRFGFNWSDQRFPTTPAFVLLTCSFRTAPVQLATQFREGISILCPCIANVFLSGRADRSSIWLNVSPRALRHFMWSGKPA